VGQPGRIFSVRVVRSMKGMGMSCIGLLSTDPDRIGMNR